MISHPAEDPADAATARRDSVTKLLGDLRDGRRDALDELFPLVYEELRELAHRQRSRWKGDDTLDTTGLVHEAYLKLVDHRRAAWDTEAHFLATAAKAIRHILINYARDRRAQKRGGDWQRVSLSERRLAGEAASAAPGWEERVMALELSTASVTRGWAMARAWLRRDLGDAEVLERPE